MLGFSGRSAEGSTAPNRTEVLLFIRPSQAFWRAAPTTVSCKFGPLERNLGRHWDVEKQIRAEEHGVGRIGPAGGFFIH